MSHCAICRSTALRPHLLVAGGAGPEGLVPTTDRYGTALGDIARCASCGHMQLDPMPTAAQLDPALAEAYSEDLLAEAAGQRADAGRVLARVREVGGAVAGTPRLLDLGCWLGLLLDEARRLGWEVTGVEPSAGAAGYARTELGLDVRIGDVLEVDLPPGAYDVVVMHDVIEHLPDPRAALRRIREWSAPGGLLHLALPDAGSGVARGLGRRWWSILPTHLQYFTRSSLLRALRAEGFTPLEVHTAPKTFTVGYYLGRLRGYSPRLGGAIVGAAERTGLADRLIAPDFRDRMAVLARAPRA